MEQENLTASQVRQPRLPIPPPLWMSEEGSFAHLTLTQRLPAIVRRVLEENNFPPTITQKLERLIQELPYGIVRSLQDDQGQDLAAWATYLEPFEGRRWIDIPWYFAEVYLYRRILEATQYFLPGEWQGVDPFEPQKRSSLEKVMHSIRDMSSQINTFVKTKLDREAEWNQTELITLLYFALWGNRIDLSLFPTDAGEHERSQIETYREQANILVDDTAILAERVASFNGVRLDFIVDNAGFELFCDLCLADFLLNTGTAGTIYLHLKAQPLFVSDAMVKDVHYTLEVLAADRDSKVQSLAHRLQEHIAQGRLQCCEHPFWTAPLSFWEMPEELHRDLAQSCLIFVKGDANYRRCLGDRQWAFTTSFHDIVCYFPAPFVTLRTLKSEIVVGLQLEQVEALNHEDPQWLTNGQWGVIQYFCQGF
ncbi:damage-control phosphatase ARMT1 family protein [Microcoleus sp. FACHB-SPT15]|uniref:damage-control phosphatase ARMT1 family protein n=1 Tax=Microcoleus sp. FACHB-SPT15 TaxID=2692830 RepID=UPI0028C44BE5|nr:damage-control phosphatase ARMT1 family protein [Microcoleus sp. FACHB-SPT15]